MKTLIFLYVLLVGCIVGSFMNVVIVRVPQKMKIGFTRSQCMTCHHPLSMMDMIPIISYVSLKGRCRYCQTKISLQYPLVEVISGILAVMCLSHEGITIHALLSYLIFEMLLVLSVMDLRWMLISDSILVALACLILLDFILAPCFLNSRILGMLVLPFVLLGFNCFCDAFGEGDILVLICSGFYLGLWKSLIGFFISISLASIAAIFLLSTKKKTRKETLPFIPFLFLGIFLAQMYGEQIFMFYLKTF